MENLQKRISFEVVTSRKVTFKPDCKARNLRVHRYSVRIWLVFHMVKPVLAMNRPIQVGFCYSRPFKIYHV